MSEWTKERLGRRSWLAYRQDRPAAPLLSLCSYTRYRLEVHITVPTWCRQEGVSRDDYEVVLAEFGETPTVYRDARSRRLLDTYVFCYMPDSAPVAASWWRNVVARQGRAARTLVLNGDGALSPRACQYIPGALGTHASSKPVAIHLRRLLPCSTSNRATWSRLSTPQFVVRSELWPACPNCRPPCRVRLLRGRAGNATEGRVQPRCESGPQKHGRPQGRCRPPRAGSGWLSFPCRAGGDAASAAR